MIGVELRNDGGRTVAVVGQQGLEFTIPEGGHLELVPGTDGRSMVHSFGRDGKIAGEANVASDSNVYPISSARTQRPS